jgi:hypothetical protein
VNRDRTGARWNPQLGSLTRCIQKTEGQSWSTALPKNLMQSIPKVSQSQQISVPLKKLLIDTFLANFEGLADFVVSLVCKACIFFSLIYWLLVVLLMAQQCFWTLKVQNHSFLICNYLGGSRAWNFWVRVLKIGGTDSTLVSTYPCTLPQIFWGGKKAGKIELESWTITIDWLVISKENTCELL